MPARAFSADVAMVSDFAMAALTAAALLLAGCGDRGAAPAMPDSASEPAAPADRPAVDATVAADDDDGPRGCADRRGAIAADALVRRCVAVSPATHPPCNAANSCAMIEDEIARACGLFGIDDAAPAECAGFATDRDRAIAVVQRYYSAIADRDYASAYAAWSDEGRASGKDFAAFRAGFARTVDATVRIGDVAPIEGGAGSLYAEVPVEVEAVLADGSRQRFAGTYVVRRVNDVDGASFASRQWHIGSASLRPVGRR